MTTEHEQLAKQVSEQKEAERLRTLCSMDKGTWEDCVWGDNYGRDRTCTKKLQGCRRSIPKPCNMFKRKAKDVRDIYLKHRCSSEEYSDCAHRERKWFCSHVMYGGREPERPCEHYKKRGKPKSNPKEYVDITMFGD